jgi:predicted RND superfamily exporter protein
VSTDQVTLPAPPADWRTGLAHLLIRFRFPLFFLGLLLAAAATIPANRLGFDQSLEALYSPTDRHLVDFSRSKQTFGGDELAIVAWKDQQLLDAAGLARTSALGERFAEVPGLNTDSQQNLNDTLGTLEKTLKTFGRVPGLARRVESIRTSALQLFEGILIGPDRQTTAVVLRFLPTDSDETPPREETIRAIREIADAHQPPAHVVGEPVQVHDMFRFVAQDSALLGYASFLLLFIVILVLFRGFRWVALPIVVVQVSLLWTKGMLNLAGLELSMVSSTLTSLVMVIGVATVIHVMYTFRELRATLAPQPAMVETLRILFLPIFWTTATTAAGFAVQMATTIHPARTFGLMMTIATLLVFFAVLMLLPAGILAGQSDRRRLRSFGQSARLTAALDRLADAVLRRPLAIAVGGILFTLVVLAGCLKLEVETDFSKNFRSGTPIVRALTFVEEHLGGAGTWEVNFPAPEELDPDYLDQVRELTRRLRELTDDPAYRASDGRPALTQVMSATDGIDLLPPILGQRWQIKALNAFQPEFLGSLYNPAVQRMRILLRAREQQSSATKLALIGRVEQIASEVFEIDPRDDAAPRSTGLFVLLAFLIESLLADQWISGLLAAAILTLMMAVATRSLTLGFVALVPNVLPIILVVGSMGWLGLPINIATAMIASVSMGLTIDSSIHFLAGIERGRAAGLNFHDALRETYRSVGSALIYANIALVLGFLTLTLSNFMPLVYFGALVALAMVGGLVGNLVILPVMLALLESRRGPRSAVAPPAGAVEPPVTE